MEDPSLAPTGLSGKFDPEQLVELLRRRADLFDTILAVVRQEFHLPPRCDLAFPDRHAHISFAREVAIYLTRELSAWSYPRIGMSFKRNHSTVIHAYQLVVWRIKQSPQFAAKIEALKRKCR